MSKVRLDLRSKTDTELQQFAETHVTKMTGNLSYPTPAPLPGDFLNTLANYSTLLDDTDAAYATYLNTAALKNQARETLTDDLTKRGKYVEIASDGDAAKILSSGFEIRDESRALVDILTPTHLQASAGDHLGEIDLTWDPVKAARTYTIECRLEGDPTAPWQLAKLSTRSSATIGNLQSGKIYSFRVKATGPKGESEWSDATAKMAP